MKKMAGLVLAGVMFSASASAVEVKPVFNFGYDFGGSDLLTILSTGGTDTITAGGGFMLNGGLSMWLDDDSAIQLTLGYKSDGQTYSNGTASFSRMPIDAMYVTKLDSTLRVGVGMTYHMSPSLKCSITGVCSGSANAASATGFIGEIDFNTSRPGFNRDVYYGLRYTNISYKFSSSTKDGSSFGFIMGVAFK